MKMITRTVKIYEHTFGRLIINDGKAVIEDVHTVQNTTKMGDRLAKSYIKENPEFDGLKLLSVQEREVVYGMSLDDFIKSAAILPGKDQEKTDGATASTDEVDETFVPQPDVDYADDVNV